MGKRGPKPQPTALKLVRGNPGKRAIAEDEPRPDPSAPDQPDWIDDEAKRMFESLSAQLQGMRVLTRIDGNALSRYCQIWARWKRAEQFIQKYGESYPLKNPDGSIKCFMQFPQVAIAHKLALLLSKLEGEFGMTPSARTGLHANAEDKASDPFEEFLKKRA